MDELYVLLREKYGLDSKQSCKFYKRTTGNVILDTQYKIAALQERQILMPIQIQF